MPGIDSDTDPLYAEVDYGKKNSRRGLPPRVKVERKKFHDSQVSFSSSPASEEPGSDLEPVLGNSCHYLTDSRFDSGSVDMETPPTGTPWSPLTPQGAVPLFSVIGDEVETMEGVTYSGTGGPGTNDDNLDQKTRTMASSSLSSPSSKAKMIDNSSKRKPVPPPRSRVPAKKVSEPCSSVDQSWEDLRNQLEEAVSVECIEDILNQYELSKRSQFESSHKLPANGKGDGHVSGNSGKVSSSNLSTCSKGERLTARVADEDESHDYAEIYTPSKERLPQWVEDNGQDDVNKPPTPPLHRFPSWVSH